MSAAEMQVDLTSCDREPIHQLGHIQPFGAMLVVSSDFFIAHHSANAAEFLGLERIAQGEQFDLLLPAETLAALREAANRLAEPDDTERLFSIALDANSSERFDCSVHRSGGQLVLEFERHDPAGFGNHIASIRPMMAGLDAIGNVDDLCQAAAKRLKALLEFDRVMVYRFHPDGSGEVVAEAREKEVDSYSGLRYPKSDIPQQARELYLRNRLRIIADVTDTPVPIVPGKQFGGEPIDLSLSTLRSVSPIHIEYLRNMGVRASLSISIIVRGRLWGLFACHHYRPRALAFSNRTAAEVFSQIFSLTLDRALHDQGEARRALGQSLHERLMTRLAEGASLRDTLTQVGASIGESIPHDGASIFIDGEYVATGHAPSEEEFAAIVPALRSGPAGKILATNALAQEIDAASAFDSRAAGAMIIPVSRSPRDFFVLWRRELKQVITWAGNPEKPVEAGPQGDRLTPRKSFAAWQQTVEGRSADWTQPERDLAETLRITLLEVILRLTDAAAQDRKRANEQQDLLIAELNHRVRNILNLIRGLVNQSRHETGDAATLTKLIGGRIGALAAAHDNLTRDNWGPTSLKKLLEEEAEAYLGSKTARLAVEGHDVLIVPQAYTVLALVLHEMVTNSAKYGSLSDNSGDLLITLERNDDRDLILGWRERGGPPVQAPSRRGFGTTIIEKSIPHELHGEADVNFAVGGLEARFVVPARFLEEAEKDHEMTSHVEHTDGGPGSGSPGSIPKRVLLIEDNMIIALDTEEMLRELGVEDVLVSGSVTQALRAIEKDRPDFAVLDFNLGEESSEPVARELARTGVPFVLATGYSAKEVRFEELGARAILKKPYDKADLGKALAGDDA
ncbi:HWE histidine kinase domain-containing protein [Alteriqipengyuania lutimaris]|uniref:histidine kinase n=1 Tax=Alteriqipengyuania lutimaris TaxID=1538146 RepID=A0A395LJE3_9SPHN|nr:HWE histidine kinase domain-containing protein [Alteriqipengyuania lutimaris]MBB3033959.1 light-regulated signal transduction histidine kinase (bacteriophytochrome) [Alteriqipengyuania lutimaris]RDS77088.1 hybrid sensor histidine kinase/response regulator [Alteriqipengyuania lutimaris]